MSDDRDFIVIGSAVEHKLNADVFGIVIAHEGSLLHVRLSPSLVVAKFHEWELRVLADFDEEYDPDPPAKPVDDDNDNVIDFTKARDLRTAKTKGAA